MGENSEPEGSLSGDVEWDDATHEGGGYDSTPVAVAHGLLESIDQLVEEQAEFRERAGECVVAMDTYMTDIELARQCVRPGTL